MVATCRELTRLGQCSHESRRTRSVRNLSAFALLLGLCLLTAIGLAAQRSPGPAPSAARRVLGSILVAVPLPFAVVLHLLVRPPATVDQTAFVLGVMAFGAGAFLLLPWNGEDEGEDPTREPDPAPWWPAFERDFRTYADRSRRVRV